MTQHQGQFWTQCLTQRYFEMSFQYVDDCAAPQSGNSLVEEIPNLVHNSANRLFAENSRFFSLSPESLQSEAAGWIDSNTSRSFCFSFAHSLVMR